MKTVGEWIYEEFQKRQENNPRYSLRAFARDLNIPNSRLIQILQKKRFVDLPLANKLSDSFSLPSPQKKQFIQIVQKEIEWRKKKKSFGTLSELSGKKLEIDQFSLIADPIHYSILALMELDDFVPSISFITSQLQEDERDILEAVERLQRLGFIHHSSLQLVDPQFVETPTDIPSQALRQHQKKKMQKTLQEMENVPIDLRDITSITLPLDKNKISEAKLLIKEFRKKMAELLTCEKKDDVYHLCIQLFLLISRNFLNTYIRNL